LHTIPIPAGDRIDKHRTVIGSSEQTARDIIIIIIIIIIGTARSIWPALPGRFR
jgi:hypothetical protein